MINKLITRFIYLSPLSVVTVALSVLLGTPFLQIMPDEGSLLQKAIYSLAAGLVLSLPFVSLVHTMRQGNRFWRQLGEARDLLAEAQNLSDLNWVRNGHLSDLSRLLGEADTREANLMQVAELNRLSEDIERKHREIMGYYERD